MRRYVEILVGCFIIGEGVVVTIGCVTVMNALFSGTMWAARIGRFEVSLNNALVSFSQQRPTW